MYSPTSLEGRRALSPLAGFFGVISTIRCDLDWIPKRLKLESYRKLTEGPCCLCPVIDRGALTYTDFSPTAPWVAQIYTNASWRASHGNPISFFSVIPGLTALAYNSDWMHNKHMGTDMYFLSSVLYLLCYELMAGPPPVNLQTILKRCKDTVRANDLKPTYSNLYLQMFLDPASARNCTKKLKGTAAEVRNLTTPLSIVWQTMMDSGEIDRDNLQIRQIRLALRFSARSEHILDEHAKAYRLPPDAAAEFEDVVFRFLACQSALRHHYSAALPITERINIFNVTIKSHYVAHIALSAKFFNPRRAWCYSGEDMMKVVKLLAHSCVKGNSAIRASQKSMDKYAAFMHVMLLGDDELFR